MNAESHHASQRPFGLDPVVVGTACCIVSALCYTAANFCLRKLAAEADKAWTICIKEVVTVAVIGPWLLVQAFRGRSLRLSFRGLVLLALTGLAVQLAGNLPMQWAFEVVGIATTIPAVFGVMLISSAVFGLVFLGERVPRRSVAAIGLLIGSIVLLSLGKVAAENSARQQPSPAAQDSPVPDGAGVNTAASPGTSVSDDTRTIPPAIWSLLGIGAGCLTGMMFAVLSTVVRFSATARVPVTTIVFVVTGMGVLSLGSLSVGRLGVAGLLRTDPGQFTWMLAAGTFNLVAFLAITKGLQLTSVVHANVLNASQVAMLAVAGILFFEESWNLWVMVGIGLTIAGILFIGQASHRARDEPGRSGACSAVSAGSRQAEA